MLVVFMHWRCPSDSKSFFCAQGTTSNGVGSHESPQAEEGTSQKEPQYLLYMFVHIVEFVSLSHGLFFNLNTQWISLLLSGHYL
jgi:hypothetical protein